MVGGGTLLGTETASQVMRTRNVGQAGAQLRRMDAGAVETVLEAALAQDPKTESYRQGRKLQEKVARGGQVTDAELGSLYISTAAALRAKEKAMGVGQQKNAPQAEAQKTALEAPSVLEGGQAVRAAALNAMVRDSEAIGERGRDAFISTYDGTADSAAFYGDFMQYYNAGTSGLVRNVWSQTLEQGVADKVNWPTGPREGPLGDTVDSVAKALGVQVVFEESISSPDGRAGGANGRYKDGTIHIAMDAADPVLEVVKHEATHRMQELAPGAYRKYRDYAVRLAGTDAVQRMQEARLKAGEELTSEGAMDELAADLSQKLLTDRGSIDRFIREDRSTARRFFDALKKAVQTIREKLGRAEPSLEQAERLWKDAFRAAERETLRVGQGHDTMTVTTNKGVRYSVGEGDQAGSSSNRGLHGDEGREGVVRRRVETAARFHQRVSREGYFSRRASDTDYWAKRADHLTAPARQTMGLLQELGCEAEVIEGYPLYHDGEATVETRASAVTMPDGYVWVNNSISARKSGGHTAYHELLHSRYIRGKPDAEHFLQTGIQNIDLEAKDTQRLVSMIAAIYFDGDIEKAHSGLDYLLQEFMAFVSGELADPKMGYDLHSMFRDFNAVKAAWDVMVQDAKNDGAASRDGASPQYSLKAKSSPADASRLRELDEYLRRQRQVTTAARTSGKAQAGDIAADILAKDLIRRPCSAPRVGRRSGCRRSAETWRSWSVAGARDAAQPTIMGRTATKDCATRP